MSGMLGSCSHPPEKLPDDYGLNATIRVSSQQKPHAEAALRVSGPVRKQRIDLGENGYIADFPYPNNGKVLVLDSANRLYFVFDATQKPAEGVGNTRKQAYQGLRQRYRMDLVWPLLTGWVWDTPPAGLKFSRDKLRGRDVWKWQVEIKTSTGLKAGKIEPLHYLRLGWYDPEWHCVLREEHQRNGLVEYTRDLEEANLKPLPDSVFQVPDGYAEHPALVGYRTSPPPAPAWLDLGKNPDHLVLVHCGSHQQDIELKGGDHLEADMVEEFWRGQGYSGAGSKAITLQRLTFKTRADLERLVKESSRYNADRGDVLIPKDYRSGRFGEQQAQLTANWLAFYRGRLLVIVQAWENVEPWAIQADAHLKKRTTEEP
ncbi:MAG: hypothetical protein KF760_12285 [Candidatus Eremiobacteraeota bacterium]|nr:hypothetical protein [Candidatus Eremiobacteraeota bacterium]MCW5870365.1 hypothetical protein [Candidatus Eremiobacteraeota bacterium]